MPIESKTEREEIIKLDGKIDKLDGKVDYVVESLERVIKAFENLEAIKISDHETRITSIERWVSEWKGVNRFGVIIATVLGIVSILYTLLKNH